MLHVVSLGERDVRIGTFNALSLWEDFLQSNKLPVDMPVVQSLLTRAQLSISKVEITFAGFISRSSRDGTLSDSFGLQLRSIQQRHACKFMRNLNTKFWNEILERSE